MTTVLAPPRDLRPLGRRRSITDVLADARTQLNRLTPAEAAAAHDHGDAVVVDIRPAAQRAVQGGPDDVLVIERNVLEWRFDPQSDAALPIACYDLQIVVLCQEGFTSSLAAAALQDLGLHRATDVIGGWAAWREELGTARTGGPDARTSPHEDAEHRRRRTPKLDLAPSFPAR